MRVVAVRPDADEAVGGHRHRHDPAVLGLRAGDRRVQLRQLVHELAGPLHERLLARTRRRRRLVRADEQDALVARPAEDVRRLVLIDEDRMAAAELAADERRHRRRQDAERVHRAEVPPQRLERRRRVVARHDDRAGAHDAAVGHDLHALAAGADARDGGALEDQRPPPHGFGGQAEGGAVRIDEGVPRRPDRADALEPGLLPEPRGRQPRTLDACRAHGRQLAPQPLVVAVAQADAQRGIGHQLAADPEPPDRRPEIQAGAPERLPQVARDAETVPLLQLAERHRRLEPQQARARRRSALADAVRLDERDADAGRREHVGGRAAGEAAADDRHLHVQFTAVTRIRGLPGFWISIQPVGNAVAGSHDFNRRSRRILL